MEPKFLIRIFDLGKSTNREKITVIRTACYKTEFGRGGINWLFSKKRSNCFGILLFMIVYDGKVYYCL